MAILGALIIGLFCLPGDLVAWAILLVVRALWGSKSEWSSGTLVVELREGSWPTKTWYRGWGGTTFGHGIMIGPDQVGVLPHEHVHVLQYEAACCMAVLVGLVVLATGAWLGALLAWCLIPSLAYVGAVIAALLRGRQPYRDNVLEAAAYAEAP